MAQHRNYGEIMARHERENKIKRVIKIFMYFLIVAFMIILYFIVRGITERQKSTTPGKADVSMVIREIPDRDTVL